MSTAARSGKSPRELYSIAKNLGSWDPQRVSLAEDRLHWGRINQEQKEQLIKVCALFYEGEVSVSDTLAWFMLAMPDPDRRMFLSSQVFEEVKHAEFFERFFQEICGNVDTSAYLVPEYRGVLLDELRQRGEAMGRAMIAGDRKALDLALTLFAAHYMGVVEGELAVTGYVYFDDLLAKTGMFPGLHEGIRLIRADEGRHIVHGMDYLRQMIAEHPEFAEPVRELFMRESMQIPSRSDFIFTPNPFELDRDRLMALSYSHVEQRLHEAGLA